MIFVPLGQTTRNWYGITVAPNGDVYAVVTIPNGDIFKQTGGVGNFISLNQASLGWRAIAAAPNGDIYATVYNGDIYKQTGGVGNFIALNQTIRPWTGITVAPNGDVYVGTGSPGQDIYKQTGGSGNFIALNQAVKFWNCVAAAPNGDIYAGASNGSIYKQTGGIGNFISLNQASRVWTDLTTLNDDVYASCAGANQNIYKQTGKVGDFISLNLTSRPWSGLATTSNGDIYASVYGGDIYESARSPSISVQPNDLTKNVGQTATFSVTASGIPSPFYEWFLNGKSLSDGNRISGSTTNTLTIINFMVGDAGNYSVRVYNGELPDVISNNAILTFVSQFSNNQILMLRSHLVSGIISKIESFRHDDPLFAQTEPSQIIGIEKPFNPITSNIAGVLSSDKINSKEGFSNMGYDKNF